MRVAISENHPTDRRFDKIVVLHFEDDADIEVEIVEDDEDHWANRWTARPISVSKLLHRITLRRGDTA